MNLMYLTKNKRHIRKSEETFEGQKIHWSFMDGQQYLQAVQDRQIGSWKLKIKKVIIFRLRNLHVDYIFVKLEYPILLLNC